MKMRLTLLAALGCLFALTLTTSCNKPDEKTDYATDKAGERLVERIDESWLNEDGSTETYTTYFSYNSDGSLKTIKEGNGNRIYSFERNGNTLLTQDIVGDNIEKSSFDLNEK